MDPAPYITGFFFFQEKLWKDEEITYMYENTKRDLWKMKALRNQTQRELVKT